MVRARHCPFSICTENIRCKERRFSPYLMKCIMQKELGEEGVGNEAC
jgi:hypothetical protein